MDYLIAWGLVVSAGLATLAGIFLLTRTIPWAWLRSLVRCLFAVWLLIPAEIVAVDGYYAPAFVVAVFEGFFRSNGDPGPALSMLAWASALVLVLFLIVILVQRRRKTS